MSFLDQIFSRLQTTAQPVLTELRDPVPISVTGQDLLARISVGRAFLACRDLQKGRDAAAAQSAFAVAAPVLMRAAQKGIIHKNTASRKVSRLAIRVKALA